MACQIGLKGFGHYMDDYHISVPPDRDPKEILRIFIEKSAELDIKVSLSKTKIVPMGEAFKFCKMKRWIKNGKIMKRGCLESARRAKRKIKMFARSNMKYEDVYTSVNSTLSYFDRTFNHGTQLRLKRLFYSLFGFPCDRIEECRRRDANGVRMPQAIPEERSERQAVQP